MPAQRHAGINAYLAMMPPQKSAALQTIRAGVSSALPRAVVTISYDVPASRDGRVFFCFAGFKQHIGAHPPLEPDPALIAHLAPWRGPRGNLKSPPSADIPLDMVDQTARTLWRQYTQNRSQT